MATFLLRRLGLMVLTLFLLSLLIFFAGKILPGDPGRATLGPRAAQSAEPGIHSHCLRIWIWIPHPPQPRRSGMTERR